MAERCGLDQGSPYSYLLWCDQFSATSVVAEAPDGCLLGYVTAFMKPDDPGTLFVWQIGVTEEARGQGIGAAMLDELAARTACDWLEATVEPDNVASDATFRSFAGRHGAGVQRTLAYAAEVFPVPHADEWLMRVGPLRARVPGAGGQARDDETATQRK